ncbi:MAG TPA: fibronectin type III domain-containing protein, partial [Candidatus Eisenbacteria bacterium]|nr:fibronectin type III domain-containing protein [Candidatus Eisenbacteria bacterium]
FPAMGAAQVKDRLIRLSDPLPSLAGRCVSGGRLNLALATADPDTIPPGAITDLRLVTPGSNSVELAWTATGDDSTAGTATRYDLRWSTAPITAANVDSAALAPAPAPQPSGSAESARVAGLRQLTPYWFAVRARDEFGNAGPLGNVVTTTTLGPPHLTLSPLAVNDALATGLTDARPVTLANDADGTLEWTAPAPVLDLGATPAAATPPGGWPASALVKGETAPPRAAQTDAAGGPDAFGYRWLDSDERAGPAFAWVDIATPANALALTGDDAITAPLPLGFSFPFYGHRFTSVRVCTNGFLSFDNTQPVFLNSGLPGTGAPRDLVAPFWDDLDFGAGVQRAYAAFDGTRYIVAWVGVPRYHDPASVMTFEAILYPSGEIRFQYRTMTGTTTACTVGLQDSTRTVGLLVAFNQAFVKDSLAVRVVPLRQWLNVTPAAGVIAPHASQTVQVGFAAAGLATGTYTGQVRFLTNDPAAPDTGVAASLVVQGAPGLRLGADSLDFGAEVVGARDTLALVVGNDGVDTLHVRGVTADPAVFQPLFGAFTVLPGAARTVQVAFAPDTALVFKGALA